jgi:2-hydroxychromene-2-carboxylate isomerase
LARPVSGEHTHRHARGATWADQQGQSRGFARAAFGMAFGEGIDLTPRAAVLEAADRAGLNSAELDAALDDPQLKQRLREANDAAIAQGVYGGPTFDAGGLLWWGDHLLPAAAAALGRDTSDG